jgi:hypothetical protein
MARPEPTILTKFGRLTGREWIRARFQESMDAWWTPQLDAYLAEAWPSPEQIEANARHRAQAKRTQTLRLHTAQAIADCARVDRAASKSGSQAQSATPIQLPLI